MESTHRRPQMNGGPSDHPQPRTPSGKTEQIGRSALPRTEPNPTKINYTTSESQSVDPG